MTWTRFSAPTAPVPAIENVEVLDRFNGVPTFGLFSAGGER